MIVRKATRQDLLGIGRVAEAAYWTSYEDLLRPDVIGRLVSRDFSPSRLGRRLLRGGMFVATLDDQVIGFGDGAVEPDRLHVDAVATDPAARRRGVGSALVTAVRQLEVDLPIAADVLLGHLEGEQFLEHNGFVPGEITHGSLFSVDVVERRWWNDAVAASDGDLATAG